MDSFKLSESWIAVGQLRNLTAIVQCVSNRKDPGSGFLKAFVAELFVARVPKAKDEVIVFSYIKHGLLAAYNYIARASFGVEVLIAIAVLNQEMFSYIRYVINDSHTSIMLFLFYPGYFSAYRSFCPGPEHFNTGVRIPRSLPEGLEEVSVIGALEVILDPVVFSCSMPV